METIVYLVVFIALGATVYGRHVATRNDALLADADRPQHLAEKLILGLVCFVCLVMTAEVFLDWRPWLTAPDAPWSMVPALLWSTGMLLAPRHPLDRTSVGTGLATLLPHVYQTVMAEPQLLSAGLSLAGLAIATFVALRRESADRP
ncbi:MAG: hypothetical protein FJ384_06685 [Verrucomicrobia bacterium]|nr:hypothetical protein [Verrucomicrobiota bacterium]